MIVTVIIAVLITFIMTIVIIIVVITKSIKMVTITYIQIEGGEVPNVGIVESGKEIRRYAVSNL